MFCVGKIALEKYVLSNRASFGSGIFAHIVLGQAVWRTHVHLAPPWVLGLCGLPKQGYTIFILIHNSETICLCSHTECRSLRWLRGSHDMVPWRQLWLNTQVFGAYQRWAGGRATWTKRRANKLMSLAFCRIPEVCCSAS